MNDFQTYDEAQSQANQSRYAMDSKLYVTFYVRPVMHTFKSSQEGRPIYEEKEYVRIIVPGDSKTTVDCPVTDEFRMRFSKQYDKFKKGLEQAVVGTPLEMWPQMTVGLCAELKAMNISTVEQLAELDDSKAQVFLDAAKGEAENNKIVVELEKRDAEITMLKQQMQHILDAQRPKAKAA